LFDFLRYFWAHFGRSFSFLHRPLVMATLTHACALEYHDFVKRVVNFEPEGSGLREAQKKEIPIPQEVLFHVSANFSPSRWNWIK